MFAGGGRQTYIDTVESGGATELRSRRARFSIEAARAIEVELTSQGGDDAASKV